MFNDTRVAYAGDWHGDMGWAVRMIDEAHDLGATMIYHLGDFGIWPGPGGGSYRKDVMKRLERRGMKMVVTLGNHEDYNQIEKYNVRNGWITPGNSQEYFMIAHRGQVWQHGDFLYASMGGAYSVDKEWRVQRGGYGKDRIWWEQEAILDEHIDALRDNLNGRTVDVFLSHEFPSGTYPGPAKTFRLEKHIELESIMQRDQLRKAVDLAKPRWLFHGHWHIRMNNTLHGEDYTTNVIGLDMQHTSGNMIVIDHSLLESDTIGE